MNINCSKTGCEEEASQFLAPHYNGVDDTQPQWPVCDDHLQEAVVAMATVVPAITIIKR